MPRPVVLGNGKILINYDENYSIKDLFYPQVGLYNHLNGKLLRVGIWADGHFSWLDEPEWKKSFDYLSDTLVSKCILSNRSLGLRIEFLDCVDPYDPVFVRKIKLINTSQIEREVHLFFSHDLCIAESEIGDTAFYFPHLDAMVHYKGPHTFAFGGKSGQNGIDQYATGIKAFDHLLGTWKDAEDGKLSMNPIAQGSVDSTFSLRMIVKSKESAEGFYWLICAHDLEELIQVHKEIQETTSWDAIIQKTKKYWSDWVDTSFKGLNKMKMLPKEDFDFMKRSLLILRTQMDAGGGILAANDSDILETNKATYCYIWPRDGAYVSNVLLQLGHTDLSHQFLQFCASLLKEEYPFLLQKYRPDKTLGSSWLPWVIGEKLVIPFQEDETALTVDAIWRLYEKTQDQSILEEFFESYVLPTCHFMAIYRHPETFLPLPSWDLWEERRGVHLFTTCAVILAMRAAAKMSKKLGHEKASFFQNAEAELLDGLQTYLFDEKSGLYCRTLTPQEKGPHLLDQTPDASILALLLFDILPAEDQKFRATYQWLKEKLLVCTSVGGYARYEGDYYFRVSPKYPGNPWIICSCWFAQVEMKMAKSIEELRQTYVSLEWIRKTAASTGVLSEQIHPETGKPLSVSPLTWSHSEYLATVLTYLDRYQSLR